MKHKDTRKYISEILSEGDPEYFDEYETDLNPKIEHERCGCDHCLSEWIWWEEFKKD